MNNRERIPVIISACICSSITGLCVAGYLHTPHYLFFVTGGCFAFFTAALIAATFSSDDKDPEDPLG